MKTISSLTETIVFQGENHGGEASAMNRKIRRTNSSDEAWIREMLYWAIHVPDGSGPVSKEIIELPQLSKYWKNWGRAGDVGYLSAIGNEVVAAIWLRLFDDDTRAYGYIDSETPELSMAVRDGYRNRGLGTELIDKLLHDPDIHHFRALSLSVHKNNRAMNLYTRSGFFVFNESGDSYIMRKKL